MRRLKKFLVGLLIIAPQPNINAMKPTTSHSSQLLTALSMLMETLNANKKACQQLIAQLEKLKTTIAQTSQRTWPRKRTVALTAAALAAAGAGYGLLSGQQEAPSLVKQEVARLEQAHANDLITNATACVRGAEGACQAKSFNRHTALVFLLMAQGLANEPPDQIATNINEWYSRNIEQSKSSQKQAVEAAAYQQRRIRFDRGKR